MIINEFKEKANEELEMIKTLENKISSLDKEIELLKPRLISKQNVGANLLAVACNSELNCYKDYKKYLMLKYVKDILEERIDNIRYVREFKVDEKVGSFSVPIVLIETANTIENERTTILNAIEFKLNDIVDTSFDDNDSLDEINEMFTKLEQNVKLRNIYQKLLSYMNCFVPE